jgi:hypothetical protein
MSKSEQIQPFIMAYARDRAARGDGPAEYPDKVNRAELVAWFMGGGPATAGRSTVLKALRELRYDEKLLAYDVKVGGRWRVVYIPRGWVRHHRALNRARGLLARHGVANAIRGTHLDPALGIYGTEALEALVNVLERVR